MKEAMSAPSAGSALGAGAGMSIIASPPSVSVSFLCLMRILRFSWLGEGRTVVLGSTGTTSNESTTKQETLATAVTK